MLVNLLLIFAAGGAPADEILPVPGSISGTVINASHADAPVAGAGVALRVNVDGQFVVAGETTTDEHGRFSFENIPADPEYVYLPGANWQTVHYPAERLRLTGESPHVDLQIPVRDVIKSPNPLTVRNHRIVIEPKPNAIQVTESLVVENPSQSTFIGEPKENSNRAATLVLTIPSDFSRVTFHKEFFGRRFTVIDGKLVTDIPWEPGIRELEFTYTLPTSNRHRTWDRPLDLPTSHVEVVVQHQSPGDVSGNIPRESAQKDAVTFASTDLSTGHVLHVEFGRLPLSTANLLRWSALLIAIGMIGATVAALRLTSSGSHKRIK